MQDAAVKVKTIIMIEGQVFSFDGEGENIFECAEESRQGAVRAWIRAKFKVLRAECRSDYEAMIATAAELDIGIKTVERYVKNY